MFAGLSYLHEVVCSLHLGHEVLHCLLSDHRVGGRRWSDVVHSNGWFWSQLGRGLVLQGVHHLQEAAGVLEHEAHTVTQRSVVVLQCWIPEPPLPTPPLGLSLCCCMQFLEWTVCLQTETQGEILKIKHSRNSSSWFVWFIQQNLCDTNRHLTSVVSTLIGSVYFSVAVPSGEMNQNIKRSLLSGLQKHLVLHNILCYVCSYQVLTAAPRPWTQPPQPAPPVPLPARRSHSGAFVLCQSNHSAALCPECPSVTYLEQRQCGKSENMHTNDAVSALFIVLTA